nr:TrbG/VirB9 family P-type conjugative transfer protein [Brevundimonas naejangsanensis]
MDAGRRLSLNLRMLAALGAFAGGAACFSAAVDAAAAQTAQPYLTAAPADVEVSDRRERGARAAPAPTAQQSARGPAAGDAFIGGVKLFAPSMGRIYEVSTAPLRVTVLLLPPGETVIAKAAGDTVRWRIAEASSGQGAAARTQVLIKPLTAGLETNLILSTNRQTYLLHLRSGSTDGYYAAVGWDAAAAEAVSAPPSLPPASALPLEDAVVPAPDEPAPIIAAGEPEAGLDNAYRLVVRGRRPAWTPNAVFNDGRRTFIVLDASVVAAEAPVLFLVAQGRSQLINYRQSGQVLIVDRLFDEAELRLGGGRGSHVRILRTGARQ